MNAVQKNIGIRTLILLLVAALILLGGLGLTGVTAQAAIPGDALYPLKTTIEQTRLTMAGDAGDRAQMKMEFAEQRLEEIAALIEEGRFRDIGEAVLDFEQAVNSAILELETVAETDPSRSAQIALEITSALTRYAQTLSVMAATAPESVKPFVARALDTTQVASGLELPRTGGGGDNDGNTNANSNDDNGNSNDVDGNANSNADSSNTNGDGDNTNANSNGNDDSGNSNDDDGNMNANSNDDGGNSNGIDDSTNNNDDNGNSNDDGNMNANSNDDSGNSNGDDNGNANSDDNAEDNANDDNMNSNSNDDNSNEDDNDNGDDNSGSGSDDNSNNSGSDGYGGTTTSRIRAMIQTIRSVMRLLS